jgi:heme O synthase-like polyprenyltransferase
MAGLACRHIKHSNSRQQQQTATSLQDPVSVGCSAFAASTAINISQLHVGFVAGSCCLQATASLATMMDQDIDSLLLLH